MDHKIIQIFKTRSLDFQVVTGADKIFAWKSKGFLKKILGTLCNNVREPSGRRSRLKTMVEFSYYSGFEGRHSNIRNAQF